MSQLNIRKLPDDLKKIAEKELNENNEQKIVDSLELIRNWLTKQIHLKSRTDDQFLIAFLRSSKYSLERTKEKLDAYYTIRTAIPELFSNRDPCNDKLQKIIHLGISIYLPKPHPNNSARIILNRPFNYNPNEFSLNDIIKYAFMASDLATINDDNLIIAGQLVIIDLKGLSTTYANEITPMFIKKFIKIIQDGYPYRQKGIHFINPPKIFDVLFKIAYNFMHDKFRKRVYVHNNLELLYSHIPKDCLPTEYGGQLGPLVTFLDKSTDTFMEFRDWFLQDDKYGTDESKRTEKSKYSDLFGVDGTFRQLQFD